jgi:hypothetical protein
MKFGVETFQLLGARVGRHNVGLHQRITVSRVGENEASA